MDLTLYETHKLFQGQQDRSVSVDRIRKTLNPPWLGLLIATRYLLPFVTLFFKYLISALL